MLSEKYKKYQYLYTRRPWCSDILGSTTLAEVIANAEAMVGGNLSKEIYVCEVYGDDRKLLAHVKRSPALVAQFSEDKTIAHS